MLLELSVARIALIESVALHFTDGLHVFTGETGAGKSILLDAIGLLLGNRGSADFVRTGENDAFVEALFSIRKARTKVSALLSEWGLESDSDELLLSRQFYRNGRTVCRINGRIATVQMLREMGANLVQQHGQHDHQGLLHPDEQLRMLDLYGHLDELVADVERLYQIWKNAKNNCQKARMDEQERMRKIDILKFQIEEIELAQMTVHEDEELRIQRQKLQHADKIYAAVQDAISSLEGGEHTLGAVGFMAAAADDVSEALKHDAGLSEISSLLENATVYTEEALRGLQQYSGRLDSNPEQLLEIENRLVEIRTLTRKYGPGVSDVLIHLENAKKELSKLLHHADYLIQLEQELNEHEIKLQNVSLKLHDARVRVAKSLASQVLQVLRELCMPSAKLTIEVEPNNESAKGPLFGPKGIDTVQFLFSANKGEVPKPLQKVASGGELSRTLLAIKAVLAQVDDLDTLIFDEIDTGVSGDAALAIARQLLKIGSVRQVLCVTHSAQIAAAGKHHFMIEKQETKHSTKTGVLVLDEPGRIKEIARLIGRSASNETAQSHAVAMLASFRPH